MSLDKRIDCHKCRHYFITWEPSNPHGCRAMGFKSRQLPSAVVYQYSGEQCQAFQLKNPNNYKKSDP